MSQIKVSGADRRERNPKARSSNPSQPEHASSPERFPLHPISWGSDEFVLTRPLEAVRRLDRHLWVLESERLGFLGYGSTFEEALEAFSMEFSSAWHHIAEESDHRLTEDARALKAELLALVAEVTHHSAADSDR